MAQPCAAAAATRAESESSKSRQDDADTRWLQSLSEAELDLLISLKELAVTRASNAGFPTDLADRIFHLRALRALGIVLLQESKERLLRRASANTNMLDRLALLDDPSPTQGQGEGEVVRPSQHHMTPLPNGKSLQKKRKQKHDGLDGEEGGQGPKRPKAREE